MLANQSCDQGKDVDVPRMWMIQPGWARENQPSYAFGVAQGTIQRDRRSHRNPSDHCVWNSEVFHQRDKVISETGQADLNWIAQRLGLAVRAAVKGNQAHTRLWFKQTERLREISAQPVLEEKGRPFALVAIAKAHPVALEELD